MTYTFIVSDESVNVYGTILKTQGIELQDFQRNPVMYYNHDRERGVIGRWENLRKDGNTLLADAVFDTKTELGAKVARQVEDGFLRTASVGFEILETEVIDNIETITRSRLKEISIVDIPANSNAVKLAMPKNKIMKLNAPIYKDLRSELIRLFGLNNNATDMAIIEQVRTLLAELENVANLPELADIDEDTRKEYRALYRTNRRLFDALVKSAQDKTKETRNMLINNALREGRISYAMADKWHTFAHGMKIDTLAFVLSSLPKALKITEFIDGTMTLEEYVRYNPKALQEDPDLLKRLLAEAVKNAPEGGAAKTLDWYRKNNPKYLQEHPEVYQRLVEEETKRKKH